MTDIRVTISSKVAFKKLVAIKAEQNMLYTMFVYVYVVCENSVLYCKYVGRDV